MPTFANNFKDFQLGLILITWRKLVGGGATDAGIPIDVQTARESNILIPDEVLEHLHMKRSGSSAKPAYQNTNVSWTALQSLTIRCLVASLPNSSGR